jgi:hypothetical protein
LPYDQRGCCGPLDDCGRFQKLQLRYDVIGVRGGGPVGAGWLWISSGQLLVAEPTNWDWFIGYSTGHAWPLQAPDGLAIFPRVASSAQPAAWCRLVLDAAGFYVVYAEVAALDGYCDGELRLPVIDVSGPADPPDEIIVRPLRWYQASAYPYLGP